MDSLDLKLATTVAASMAAGAALYRLLTAERESSSASGVPRSTTASGSLGSSVYEAERAGNEYLLFHYGVARDMMPYADGPISALDFAARCGALCNGVTEGAATGAGPRRALDIGCAVGRSSFEMARTHDEVVGIDFSHNFIRIANDLKASGRRKYTCQLEGNLFDEREARVDPSIDRARCTFEQGDACDLPERLGQFDVVLAANLLCRLPRPEMFFDRLPSLVKTGGHVVLVSPYSYLEEYTPVDKWFGGKEVDGKRVRACDAVAERMTANGFELVSESDIPFLIREHIRKYQWGCSHCAVWRKA